MTGEITRCGWATGNPLMVEYHDTEWGVPVHEDRKHFEFLVLEGAQAGLSWLTVLNRREGYRKAFAGFDPEIIAMYGEREIERLLADAAIIRNRAKVLSTLNNAQRFLEVQRQYGSFNTYIWQFVGGSPIRNSVASMTEIAAKSPESEEMSKDLVRRGFKFVGPTICYAHMQATGMVNDHLVDCFRYGQL